MNPRPLIVCSVLSVPCFAIGIALHDRPPDTVETSLEPNRFVVEEPVATTAVTPATTLGAVVVSLPPAPAVVATQTADRGISIQVTDTVPPPPPTGINGLPFAPAGLAPCDEMMFYAYQFGLPDWFRGIGWRESNCRNEDGVKTWCCHGYWQLHHIGLADHRTRPRWRDECGVTSVQDFNSATPAERQRQACAAAVLYSIQGADAWSATT